MLATGTSIQDRYVVERMLARGGMATVYIVRHTTLDTQYALKVLDIQTAEIRARLLQEGRIQASLKHPNIVAVTDSIEIENHPALVMEYVDGPTLAEAMAEGVSREQGELWFRQIVSAVSYAHARGLVHRDLKPENVLMAPMIGGYLPKVADFGIAKVVQDYLVNRDGTDGPRTKTGIGMGTPAYMPPEQVQSAGDVDHRADVFALGCILYELMCGERAFPGDNLLSILNAIADGDYTPPWQHRDDLDKRIVAAIDGALEPNTDLRIQSCDVLLEVLSGKLQRETKTPAPVGVRTSSRRPLTTSSIPFEDDESDSRGSMGLIIAGIVALLVGIGLVVGLVLVGGLTGAAFWMQPESGDPKAGMAGTEPQGVTIFGSESGEPTVIHGPITIPGPTSVAPEPVTPTPVTPTPAPVTPTPTPIVERGPSPTPQPSGLAPKNDQPVPVALPAPVPVPNTADKTIDGPFEVSVSGWREASVVSTAPNLTLEPEEQGFGLYLVDASLTRNDTTHDANTFPWALVGPDGQEYRANFQCYMMTGSSLNPMETYDAGDSASGQLCFVAPPGLQGARVRFSGISFGGLPQFFPLN